MNELESFIKRHNISEKDMYLLSKLESLKKIGTSKNINKISLKQEAILKNYGLTEPEKIKLFEMLKDSIFHQIRENVIKYGNFDNEIVLENDSNQTNKKKIFIFFSVFIGVLILFNLFGNKNNPNSSYSGTSTYTQPCEDMDSYNQGVIEGRGQKGILIDCDTYYPYPGWADNKECYCKGFNDGKNQ